MKATNNNKNLQVCTKRVICAKFIFLIALLTQTTEQLSSGKNHAQMPMYEAQHCYWTALLVCTFFDTALLMLPPCNVTLLSQE